MNSQQPLSDATADQTRATHHRIFDRKPVDKVDVYVCDHHGNNAVFVRTVPLKLLVRFSKAAVRAFPKSDFHVHLEHDPSRSDIKLARLETRNDAAGSSVDPGDLANMESQESGADHGGASRTASIDKPQEPANQLILRREDSTSAGTDQVLGSGSYVRARKQLFLKLNGAYVPAHHSAISTCLDWMNLNSDIHNYAPLRAFHISGGVSLPALVNAYAAILTLDMRPFPREVRHNLLSFLTESPPNAADLNYLFYRIPDTDVTLTRAITSIVEAQETSTYQDDAGLKKLLQEEEWLRYRFKKLRNYRNKSRKEHNARSSMDEQWQALEKAVAPDSDEQASALEGRRRPRRDQHVKCGERMAVDEKAAPREDSKIRSEHVEVVKAVSGKEGNGRGKCGRHVPGAEY